MNDPTAQSEPVLTTGQRLVAAHEMNMIAEPWELAAAIDAVVSPLRAALRTAVKVADEARDEWDKVPSGMKAGKLLIALSQPSLNYRADITAMHAVLSKTEG